ncbi:hypothetical protein CAEBREN_17945 [Caenorhabditis brenneri]|uniref:Uncharacterized protein n=1 Tax=Caenorhabditis brenneri TaxID=135651 RepID=G0NS47_CAEBE|nr:hypothetical protein CAEBREN_17945 [Caenorhabditis brenneri]
MSGSWKNSRTRFEKTGRHSRLIWLRLRSNKDLLCLKRTAPSFSDSDNEDFQQTTLDTLRLIQQNIADSKKETLDSQKVLAEGITNRFKHLEQVGAQQTVVAKSELNKALLETIQWKTEELKKKQDARDEELKKMRQELREMKSHRNICWLTIQFKIQTQDKRRFPMKMRWDDLVQGEHKKIYQEKQALIVFLLIYFDL